MTSLGKLSKADIRLLGALNYVIHFATWLHNRNVKRILSGAVYCKIKVHYDSLARSFGFILNGFQQTVVLKFQ